MSGTVGVTESDGDGRRSQVGIQRLLEAFQRESFHRDTPPDLMVISSLQWSDFRLRGRLWCSRSRIPLLHQHFVTPTALKLYVKP